MSTGYSNNAIGAVDSMSGYLNKKTRDGRWQKRWFETNGVYLTCKYIKASISLASVCFVYYYALVLIYIYIYCF